MAVGMLVLTAAIHTLVTVSRLDAWCGARSRRRLLMIVAMALLTALALWVEILLSVAEAVNGMLMAGWSKAQLVYVVQRITLLWALLYRGLGLFPALEGSLYFSGIPLTTVGYGDMTLPACWRLLSVAEAVNGVLMAGWSTAQLVYVVQRITLLRLVSEGRLP